MLMLDLDHFKSINDRFGHAIGDEVLRVFANAARSNMRGSDLVGRLGGEEFAVIVAEPMEFAARIAERLRASFETAGIQIGDTCDRRDREHRRRHLARTGHRYRCADCARRRRALSRQA